MNHRSIARMFLALVAGLTIGSSAAQQAGGASAAVSPPPLPPTPIPAVARWDLSIDGHTLATFNDLVVISSTATLPASPPTGVSALVITPHTCTVALRRQVTRGVDLAAWHDLVIIGDLGSARKSFSLVAYDMRGMPLVRYHVTDGYPSKLEIDGLKSGANEVLFENVTFTCEFLQRVSP